jgi:hypothetical protein
MTPFPLHRTHITHKPTRERVRAAEKDVTRLQRLGLSYAWGGGRDCGYDPCKDGPGDCSWFAGAIVNAMGVRLPFPASSLSTYSLAEAGLPGHGRYLTLYIKNVPGRPEESHVIVGLRGRFAECGGSDNPHPGDGPGWFHPGELMGLTVHQRLSEFTTRRHFHGF